MSSPKINQVFGCSCASGITYNSPLNDGRFMAAIGEKKAAFYCDCDGSLGIYTPGEHDNVPPDHDLEKRLEVLVDLGVPVAINTGRPKIFISRILPNLEHKIPVATEHGALVHVGGVENDLVTRPVNVLDIRTELLPHLEEVPGCFVEGHKLRSMTAQCTSCEGEGAFIQVVNLLRQAAERVNNQHGTPVLRVKESNIPGNIVADLIHIEADKHHACAFIHKLPEFSDKMPIAVIDSSGDRSMAEWVRKKGGWVITVGEYDGVIPDFRVRDTRELRSVFSGIGRYLNQEETLEHISGLNPLITESSQRLEM